MEQKSEKKFLVCKIIAFETGSKNSHILEQDSSYYSQYVNKQPKDLAYH